MSDNERKPRPGWITDAEDILFDIERMGEESKGIMTAVKRNSVAFALKLKIKPEGVARMYDVSLEDVETGAKETAEKRI